MSHELGYESRWPIDENCGSIDEDIGSIFEGLIAKTKVVGPRVVELLLSLRGTKEVQ